MNPSKAGKARATNPVPGTKPATMDDYLASVSAPSRSALEKLRGIIRGLVPQAQESLSYGLPAFRLNGRPLVAFGASKSHCALYPMSPAVIAAHRDELMGYDTSKGTIRFQPQNPLPLPLLKTIIRARLAECQSQEP